MNVGRRPSRAITLAMTLCALSCVSARAQSWGDLGGTLKQACTLGSSGGALGGGVRFDGASNLQWLCTLSSLYKFVDNNLLNGDWQGFAADVLGKYLTDLANYGAGQLGMGDFNGWIEQQSDWLRGNYTQFKRGMLSAVQGALRAEANRPDDNAGLPVTTPGGLADAYVKQSPVLAGAETVGRLGQTLDAFGNIDKAYRAKKLEEQSQAAITDNVAPAINSATNVIGTPALPGAAGQTGIADTLTNKARTALSSREVAEVQVESIAELMKTNAVMNTAILNQLSEIAKQQVMTNSQLLTGAQQLGAQQEGAANDFKASLEDAAQEALVEAKGVAGTLSTALDTTRLLTDDRYAPATDLLDSAP